MMSAGLARDVGDGMGKGWMAVRNAVMRVRSTVGKKGAGPEVTRGWAWRRGENGVGDGRFRIGRRSACMQRVGGHGEGRGGGGSGKLSRENLQLIKCRGVSQ